jgi:peptidoglycan/LPS O-acetylase OafA/YrhL
VVLGWFGWALTRHLWAILKQVNRQSKPLSKIAFGLASFLVANVATFTVATQVYGDIFILLLVGTALGALLAMPVLAERALQRRILSVSPAPRAGALVSHPA